METETREQQDGPLAGYSTEPRPLGSYAGFTAVFTTAFVGALVAARRSGRELPEDLSARDVVMVGVATHKLTRLITKGKITSFVRAPFTELEGPAGRGELNERPRGEGLRRSLGELFVCPYCLGVWVSSGFAAGMVWAPRGSRLVAATLTSTAVSDFLQLAYKAAEDRT